jgi:hypothetical protein
VRSRWTALAVVSLTRLSMGFQFQSIASIAPFLIDEFRLSYAQLGWLMGLYLLPGAAIALPGGSSASASATGASRWPGWPSWPPAAW